MTVAVGADNYEHLRQRGSDAEEVTLLLLSWQVESALSTALAASNIALRFT